MPVCGVRREAEVQFLAGPVLMVLKSVIIEEKVLPLFYRLISANGYTLVYSRIKHCYYNLLLIRD